MSIVPELKAIVMWGDLGPFPTIAFDISNLLIFIFLILVGPLKAQTRVQIPLWTTPSLLDRPPLRLLLAAGENP